ncbi:MAG TPA: aldehyde oxidase [Anaerolineaceae bacterium]|uniref:Carbon monoxide dehydrogenase molybdoprotein family protein n=1 Tax=Anaerolinea thermophila TaxID=167964 RepID=A0A101FYW3_9CHLR|nr:MAG: Carbon monoxide dehydrogenase molybdoprotein family protein [Anaerolinea thermophila]HAF61251.1 aldehyde oxidase [Anaerolineaceae bacterium]
MSDYLGKNVLRFDTIDKVTGKAQYPSDFSFDNQVYLQIVFAGRPHAIITAINTDEAEAVEGVLAVLTAKDVPCNEYGLIMPDQPVLCGPGSDKENADHVRFYGDQVALVIAENEQIAKKAAQLVKIEFQELPVITDPREAMQSAAFLIHPEKEDNVVLHYKIRKGDVDKGFEDAAVIIESDYTTPVQEHAFLQPEAGVSYIDEKGRVTVVVSGQWIHEDQEQIAHALQLPLEQVRVIYPAIGGAFGGREDMSVQIPLALAAKCLSDKGIHRPVKTVWSREESFFGHHKRHPYYIHAKWGATKEGKISAVEMSLIADSGAYAYTSTKVQGNATLLSTGPYFVPNVKVDSYSVYTNNIPNGAFRGFGGPQACYAAEMQMNKLANALNLDPVEIRMRNAIQEDQPTAVRTALPKGITIEKVMKECALASGWEKTPNGWMLHFDKKADDDTFIGIGFSAGYKNVGFSFGAPENCWATIELYGDTSIEKAILRHAGADVGQGAHSAFRQFAASALDIDLEKVELIASDTAETNNAGSASASRLTFMAGNSILGAAREALKKWETEERPAIATYTYIPPTTSPYDHDTGECYPNFAYGYVAESVEVSIKKTTGELTVKRVVCANDVGKAINPLQVRGQIEGAIVQALGYTSMEKFIQKEGLVLTTGFSTYLVPTIKDIPFETVSLIIEEADPIGPEGARGMGEMPYLPFAPALCSAVFDATHVWFDEFPLTQEVIMRGLGEL